MVYLGKASNPIPLDSVFMGAVFHNYKQLLQITKEDTNIDEDYLEEKMTPSIESKPEGKISFYRYSKKRHGFFTVLHKEDRLLLLKMILKFVVIKNVL